MTDRQQQEQIPEVDPLEFARRMLQISPEDAEKVRAETPGTRKRPEPQSGPERDYGRDARADATQARNRGPEDGNQEGPAK